MEAIREAVLNAVIHRDYSHLTEGMPVQINFFENRLEIHSPGSLYGRMTVEQLGYAKPDLRNPTLAVLAENLAQAENRYSGIPTIRREMHRAGEERWSIGKRSDKNRQETQLSLLPVLRYDLSKAAQRSKGPYAIATYAS